MSVDISDMEAIVRDTAIALGVKSPLVGSYMVVGEILKDGEPWIVTARSMGCSPAEAANMAHAASHLLADIARDDDHA